MKSKSKYSNFHTRKCISKCRLQNGGHPVSVWIWWCSSIGDSPPSVLLNPTTRQSLQWRHNDRDGVSNHQPHDCLLNRLFRRRSKKTSKLRVTGLCAGNSPVTGEFPAQRASNAENVSIWWRHHEHTESIYIIADQYATGNIYTLHIVFQITIAYLYLHMKIWHWNAFRITGPLWGESAGGFPSQRPVMCLALMFPSMSA